MDLEGRARKISDYIRKGASVFFHSSRAARSVELGKLMLHQRHSSVSRRDGGYRMAWCCSLLRDDVAEGSDESHCRMAVRRS